MDVGVARWAFAHDKHGIGGHMIATTLHIVFFKSDWIANALGKCLEV